MKKSEYLQIFGGFTFWPEEKITRQIEISRINFFP